jgi:regulator of cell morphogenesis and NO signaling
LDAGLDAAVVVMLREHAQIRKTLDSLEGAMASAAARDTAPARGRQLAVQLRHHNLKDEKALYLQADAALTTAAQLGVFLDSGELPTGWVCIKGAQVTWTGQRGGCDFGRPRRNR